MNEFNHFFNHQGILFATTGFNIDFFEESCDAVAKPCVEMINHLTIEIHILNGRVIPMRVFDKVDIVPLCKATSSFYGELVKVATDEFGGRKKFMAQFARSLLGKKLKMSDLWSNATEADDWHYHF